MAKKDTKKPDKAEKKGKDKTEKKKKGATESATTTTATTTTSTSSVSTVNGVPSNGIPSTPLANLSPDQMTAAQIEQAIKESSDPASRLKKLRSPINWRSCLLNILFLIVLTFAIVILWCYLAVDKFNFVTVMSDMMDKFGITGFFKNMGSTISGWFK